MLSYAYAVLTGRLRRRGARRRARPVAGFRTRPRRAARSLIAERVVLRLVNRGEVTPEDFEATPCGVTLGDRARRALLGGLELRLSEAAPGPGGRDYR